ncbi:MAG: Ig-like domain-containing protein, partial [Lachnospiraceae bacterium]|nr:Ig-like domain-containing protein [Lachnospiraceae bacterium]
MDTIKRKIAVILSMVLMLTSIPVWNKPVYAEIVPPIVDEETGNELENHDAEFVEGEVIVCVKESGVGSLKHGYSQDDDLIMHDKGAHNALSMLIGAEDLMNVTDAVRESEELSVITQAGDENVISIDKSAPEDEYTLKFVQSDEYSTDQMIDMFENVPGVLYAEPNYIYHLMDDELSKIDAPALDDLPPSLDGSTEKKADHTSLQYAYGNGPGGMDVPDWNIEGHINASGSVIAILDTGVDYNHEDLKDVMWDDGLKYPELTALGGGKYGYNAVPKHSDGTPYMTDDPMDEQGHGTHCSGSAGAPWNGYGVSGTANGAEIMAVKVGGDDRRLLDSSILRGFNYITEAKKAGVNVVAVNNSWGGPVESCSVALAVKELSELNVLCCFASGNDDDDNDYIGETPYTLRENEGVICVNACNEDGLKAGFSNYGIRLTDVYAPGNSIESTVITGTGVVNPLLCSPVYDAEGREAKDDFEGEDTYFTYTAKNGTSFEKVKEDGNNVLAISGMSDKKSFLSVRCGSLQEKPKYLTLNDKYGSKYDLAVYIYVLMDDGTYKVVNPKYYVATQFGSENKYILPDGMNLDEPEFVLVCGFKSENTYFLNGIALTDQSIDYGKKNGTSMAAPAVTGEVAVLASKWPGDDVSKRAARIIGSTRYNDKLEGTCRTDGIANVRKALECDYSPVVSRAWLDNDGCINVSGYFFGEDTGSVSIISGNTSVDGIKVIEWNGQESALWNEGGKNEKDTIKLDNGSFEYRGDELMITVTSKSGKTGSRMLTVSGASEIAVKSRYYERLKNPGTDDPELYENYMKTYFRYAAPLNGAIFYSGSIIDKSDVDDSESRSVLWKYTLSENENEARWDLASTKVDVSTNSNICAFNRMILYMDDYDDIMMYSPESDMVYSTGITIPEIDSLGKGERYFINAEGTVYLFLSVTENSDDSEDVPIRTELYRLDMSGHSASLIYTLKSIQLFSAKRAVKNADGSVTIYSLTPKDDSTVITEIISINDDVVSSETREVKLPDNCLFSGEMINGAPNQYGIVFTGPIDENDGADNFLYSYEDGSIVKCNKQIMPGRPINAVISEYNGKSYFLFNDMYSDDSKSYAYADDDEFKGGGEAKDPLHCYGDDEVKDISKLKGEVLLNAEGCNVIQIGSKVKIIPEYSEKQGKAITYTWSSTNVYKASVDQKGYVTGIAPGTVYIYARGTDADGNEYEGKCAVTVKYPVKGIKLSDSKLYTAAGSNFKLSLEVLPEDAFSDGIQWSVSAPASHPDAVIKVRESDSEAEFKTTDVGENIRVTITARTTDGSNKQASCVVNIGVPVKGISLCYGNKQLANKETITLNEGKGAALKAVVTPQNAINKSVKWSSSNPTVATVNEKGQVSALGAGTALIYAQASDGSNIKRCCTIKVSAPVRKAELSEAGTILLGAGMEHEVSLARVLPYRSSQYTVEWKSSDESVVTISADSIDNDRAVIKAVKTGVSKISAVITNTEGSGKKIGTKAFAVKVVQSDENANILKIFNNRTDITGTISGNRLAVGKGLTLRAAAYQDDREVQAMKVRIVWKSSEPEVATGNNGKIKAYKEGDVTIVATLIPKEEKGAEVKTVSASFNLYVYNPIRKLESRFLDYPAGTKKIMIPVGESMIAGAKYYVAETKAGDTKREIKDFAWTSSDQNVASVNSLYNAVFVKAMASGKTVITGKALDGSNKAISFTVTVYDRVNGIKLKTGKLGNAVADKDDSDEITVSGLAMNKGFVIIPNIEPAGALNKNVVYRSSNPAAVIVNSKGVVKRCGSGTADIYVTTVDGGYTAVCH